MFYSHTFLAKKGPLGTVWMAAHLHTRLKKTHYSAVNILTTVDHIMCPEVPVALRISGHLLLGVVRVYSKQVGYLHNDSEEVKRGLTKAIACIDFSLPEHAMQAQPQSITIPEKFNFDDLDLSCELNFEGDPDDHLRNEEDITLPGYKSQQVPIATNPYVVINVDEDNYPFLPNEIFIPEPYPMVEDPVPTSPREGISPEDVPAPEIPRSEVNIPEIDVQTSHSPNKDVPEPHTSIDPATNSKGLTPILEENTPSIRPSPSVQPSSATPFGASLQPSSISPALIQSTPPIEQPIPRKRKRLHYDDPVVLPNKVIKKRLEDASDIKRKKRYSPSSALGIWKLNTRLRKEQVFLEPSLTGLCSSLRNISQEDLPDSMRTITSHTANVFPEPMDVEPSPSPLTTEQPVHPYPQENDGDNNVSEQMHSPMSVDSQRTDDFTPAPSPNIGPASIPPPETGSGTHIPQTPESVGTAGSTDFGTREHIPETAVTEDLSFLEADDNTSAGSQGTGVDSLSVRTRAVAKYLKSKSPTTPSSEDLSTDLSLNKILERKTRKLCARMFFETLVLKSHNLIDVKQEVPYGDISLKLTQTLSKAQI